MVYITSWPQFQREAEALYARSPFRTRYCVKWRSVEGTLVLKLTDDTTCLKYRATSTAYFHRFQALNLSLMEKMQNRKLPAPAPPEAAAGSGAADAASTVPRAGAPATSGTHAGSGKKRGGKKKK
ncbi:hypothetical protein M407DRAFT_246097 [Tulasnella calospora MUT 4182]|uniref:SRP9 domain-containing protein n=1 Tax=Tulasnella calospora MUT 4182 TaxID=1051891 RepID=A0A0C3KDX3_9AGAM|nr:hypothetical protein M407DRAFT_246097 [Tulasnella calospora MUT 4182]